MASYIALLRKDSKSDYSVDFPDFPGCITAGKSLAEAHLRAAEALAFHIEGMEEDGETIPAPSSMDAIASDPHNREAFATFVTIEPRSRVQRLNITMNADVLKRIDAYASEVGMTRSAFLAHAAMRELATGRVERHSPKSKSAPKRAPKRVAARA